MTNDFFQITARITKADGAPLPGIILAVIDRDPLIDDLLGVGVTNEHGCFQISFTTKEFRQDWFERETTPDIRLICSVRSEGELVVCHQEDWHGPIISGHNDLGDIVITTWTDRPVTLKRLKPIPGYRRVVRLDVDDALIHHAITDVAPHVERFTGWSGLLDDLGFGTTNDYADEMLNMVDSDATESWIVDRALRFTIDHIMLRRAYAIYSPRSHRVFINERAIERCNLDGFKVILGHELVHVGQFKHHPRLKKDYLDTVAHFIDRLVTEQEPSEDWLKQLLSEHGIHEVMCRIEGYAMYIQKRYLERVYTHAMLVEHMSWFERLLMATFLRTVPFAQSVVESKNRQYTDGLDLHTGHQEGDHPQRFIY